VEDQQRFEQRQSPTLLGASRENPLLVKMGNESIEEMGDKV
jgi:hypothetical protein